MKKLALLIFSLLIFEANAQEHNPWRDVDRKFLLTNLTRSREELLRETKGLTAEQWNFKETGDSAWSINQVVEHIMIWELLLNHEISRSLSSGKQPARMKAAPTDSSFIKFIYDPKQHFSLDYTKPFSYTIPGGLYEGPAVLTQFLKMRNESVDLVKTTREDLRAYFNTYGSVHQIYIYVYGHTDRHLRQIRRIKSDPGYPPGTK